MKGVSWALLDPLTFPPQKNNVPKSKKSFLWVLGVVLVVSGGSRLSLLMKRFLIKGGCMESVLPPSSFFSSSGGLKLILGFPCS